MKELKLKITLSPTEYQVCELAASAQRITVEEMLQNVLKGAIEATKINLQ